MSFHTQDAESFTVTRSLVLKDHVTAAWVALLHTQPAPHEKPTPDLPSETTTHEQPRDKPQEHRRHP